MDKIGDEELLALDGPPDLVRSLLEPVVRPGVDGTGFFDVGRRGTPQRLVSRCDYADLAAAYDALERYCQLIDAAPVAITYGDVDLSGYGVVHQVVDVRPTRVQKLAASSGGLNPPSLAWLEAEWTVLAVPVPDE